MNANKKIDFFNLLFKKLSCRQDILEYLAVEKVIPLITVQDILHQNHATHASQLASILDTAVKEEKLQLVDYAWTVLPIEHLALTIVSRDSKKEWIF